MKKILPAILIFLFTTPSILAQFTQNTSTWDYCQDNSTLIHFKHTTWSIYRADLTPHYIIRDMNSTEPEFCTYGCMNNQCVSPPWIIYGLIFGLIILAIIIYALFFR